jgi:Interleukin-like EMT inducer
MANITVQVQSLLNTALYNSYTIDNAQTINQLKTAVNSAQGFDSTWYDIVLNGSVASGSATLSSLGIVSGTRLRTNNKIGHLATKELKQKAKLDLAALDRVASSEARATYDLSALPTQYNNNAIVNNPNTSGLTVGRPWIATQSAFAFYEAFGTTVAISTTRYVSGNKIYAESSTYDVPSFQPARVVVNEIEVVNTELRGHTLVVLDSYGDVVTAATQYDTWDTGGAPGARAALAAALSAVASGRIVVLVSYDATGLDAGIRSAINTGYGSTNTNTWVSGRTSHIFIGIKV